MVLLSYARLRPTAPTSGVCCSLTSPAYTSLQPTPQRYMRAVQYCPRILSRYQPALLHLRRLLQRTCLQSNQSSAFDYFPSILTNLSRLTSLSVQSCASCLQPFRFWRQGRRRQDNGLIGQTIHMLVTPTAKLLDISGNQKACVLVAACTSLTCTSESNLPVVVHLST